MIILRNIKSRDKIIRTHYELKYLFPGKMISFNEKSGWKINLEQENSGKNSKKIKKQKNVILNDVRIENEIGKGSDC